MAGIFDEFLSRAVSDSVNSYPDDERVEGERPYWMSRKRAAFLARQDGEATLYLIETNTGDANSAYMFARSAARHARWSQE